MHIPGSKKRRGKAPTRKPPISLKDHELLALLARARATRMRDWVMIVVTYWHGLRASETVNLRVSSFSNDQVFIVRGKGSDGGWQDLQSHENPLLDEKQAIRDWLETRNLYGARGGRKRPRARISAVERQQSTQNVAFLESGSVIAGPDAVGREVTPGDQAQASDDRIFPVHRCHFWKIVHRYALAAGIPRRKCKTHMLKHTIAKHLVREGASVDELMAWLGWKSLETPMWYLQADEEELSDRIGSIIRRKAGFRRQQQDTPSAPPQ